jgi:hypothetical protein
MEDDDRDIIDLWRERASVCLQLAERETDPEMKAKLAVDGRRYLAVASRLEELDGYLRQA